MQLTVSKEFTTNYEQYLQYHLTHRSGERLRRLLEGHAHAEKQFLSQVWWPSIGNFRHLHPEYEVKDFQDGTRFIDFAYIRGSYRIAIEIDGFAAHARDIDRARFSDHLMRQNQLILDDWKVLRFSYDDLSQRSRRCQQIILHVMGHWFGEAKLTVQLNYREKDIIHLAKISPEPITSRLVSEHLGIRMDSAREWLHRLYAKGILRPARGKTRVHSYVLTATNQMYEF
ncbi:DNA-binding response regulator [Paenibacillus whitsoniae]|uniref:DNA-binding response regulator n=1 Tax=Paenibacillus whitsoniae TaxID=2496558 RepID=A0A430JFL7_9BACL|nr:DNA-binding response regulator [Paenibacillus whitsoniae]